MVDRSGQPDECDSSKAQIRTLLEEQRQTVLAECHARVSHHELQAAQAEEERRLLQGQLWQQKLEFREAHQRSLAMCKEPFGTLEPCVCVTRIKMCKCDCARAMCRKMCVQQVSVCTLVPFSNQCPMISSQLLCCCATLPSVPRMPYEIETNV